MKFTDGVEIDTSGELRKVCLHDGWYVTGKGMLMPVSSSEEADWIISEMDEVSEKNTAEYLSNTDNRDKIEKYCVWLLYQIGFSGVGTTALDKEPDFDMPSDLPTGVENALIEQVKEIARARWAGFSASHFEMLGERTGEYQEPEIKRHIERSKE